MLVCTAGTSYGVSLLYLIAALRDNIATHGVSASPHSPRVWGTEQESSKIARAQEHVRPAFSDRNEAREIFDKEQVKIPHGDIRETICHESIPDNSIDALLLDSEYRRQSQKSMIEH